MRARPASPTIIMDMDSELKTYQAKFDIGFTIRECDEGAVAIVPALGIMAELPAGSDYAAEAQKAIQAQIDRLTETGPRQEKPGTVYISPSEETLPEGAMTLREVADALGKSQSYISKITSDGRLPSISFNGKKYVTREALEAYSQKDHRRGRKPGYSPAKNGAYSYEFIGLNEQ